jgi:ribosome biogenesis GTPase
LPDAVPDALVPYGWDDRVAALSSYEASPEAIPARVTRVDRDRVMVVTAPDEHRAARGDPLPSVGDWVGVEEGGPGGDLLVTSVLTRRSVLGRRHAGKSPEGQVMASNVDLVFVVVGIDRVVLNRVERELVAAWDSGATPVVVVTKADLVDDPLDIATEVAVRSQGVDVIVTSAVTGAGIDDVVALPQPNRTVVLMGASGAGKSTLANALLGEDLLETGAVREHDHRGRHTTTSRSMVTLPRGGVLIDTPGIRSLGLLEFEEGLALAFADIEALAEGCRFRDCTHRSEPGCAVRVAVVNGDLDAARMKSYEKLQRELAHADRIGDPLAIRAEMRKWRAITKSHRQPYKGR